MNHYDAQEIMRRHNAGLPIAYGSVKEAEVWISTHGSTAKSVKREPAPAPVRRIVETFLGQFPPTMDSYCLCGLRYGQHRVRDYACPNQKWRPGNGQSQWLGAVFRRTA